MIKYFEKMTDNRQQGKTEHNLFEIVIMTVIAVIAACNYWEEIADYCAVNTEWFINKVGLTLKNGVPSHDTFQRVFQNINPKEFQQCFIDWVKSVHTATDGEIVSIDGKTVRGSKSNKSKAIHMVSAWSSKNRLVLGQTKVNKKSNEITAIPTLLELLEIKGCIVTIDAMGCQKKIAERIINENKADYIFGLKGNQETLASQAETAFAGNAEIPEITTSEVAHGRDEQRVFALINVDAEQKGITEWVGLKSFGRITSRTIIKGIEHTETRYFATSLTELDVFANAAREHWGIENGLHWELDIAFREDDNKTWAKNSAENLAVARHIAVNILKNIPSKISLERKRKKCAYDKSFLDEVVQSL